MNKVNHNRVEVVKPPVRIKFKKFCQNIHKKFKHEYVSYDANNKPSIDISALMLILVDKLKPVINEAYVRHKKYNDIDFINGIIDVVNNCAYWNRYKGKISGKYLNKKHNEYCKWGVYECMYRIILLMYFSTHKFNKLQYQCIDSSFITNLFGAEIYGRNVQYKSKNGIKISQITDRNGTAEINNFHTPTVFHFRSLSAPPICMILNYFRITSMKNLLILKASESLIIINISNPF